MKIKEAQEVVDQWIQEKGIRYFSELTNTAILMEEVGEVARIMARKYGEQSFKKSDEEKTMKEKNTRNRIRNILFIYARKIMRFLN